LPWEPGWASSAYGFSAGNDRLAHREGTGIACFPDLSSCSFVELIKPVKSGLFEFGTGTKFRGALLSSFVTEVCNGMSPCAKLQAASGTCGIGAIIGANVHASRASAVMIYAGMSKQGLFRREGRDKGNPIARANFAPPSAHGYNFTSFSLNRV